MCNDDHVQALVSPSKLSHITFVLLADISRSSGTNCKAKLGSRESGSILCHFRVARRTTLLLAVAPPLRVAFFNTAKVQDSAEPGFFLRIISGF